MRVVRLHTERGAYVGIAGEPARVYTPVVLMDCPMRLVKVPNREFARYATELDYRIKKAARQMLKAGNNLNITKSARKFLKGVWK